MVDLAHALSQPALQGLPTQEDLDYLNDLLRKHQFEPYPLSLNAGKVRGKHEDWQFRSVFQPIYRLDEDNAISLWSVEALARVSDAFGGQLPPTVLFAAETSPRRTVFLDRQLRCLHLLNFLLQMPDSSLVLSLNVNAQHLVNVSEAHGQFFADVLAYLNVPANRICLEIVEDAVNDPIRLHTAVKRYRDLGFTISLDDFGQGASNLERVWLLEPDYVKLDKVLMRHALMRPAVRDKLVRLVDILHLHGAKVVGEGIESEKQLAIARDVACDYVQGFYLAKPNEWLPD